MIPATASLITRDPDYPFDALESLAHQFEHVEYEVNCPSVLQRFKLAAHAPTENVFVQDDDARINVPQLWQAYNGETLTCAMTRGNQVAYVGTGVTLIGFGSFFPRARARTFLEREVFWREFLAAREFPDDTFDMEADRFFSWDNRPFTHVYLPVQQVMRPVRMSNRPGHYQLRDKILIALRELL